MPSAFSRMIVQSALLGGIVSSITASAYGQTSTDNPFILHGYFTQAYAKSSNLPILGITKSGRADFRLMVLQVRYALNQDAEFVTQLRHRHFGASTLTAIEPELTVSWAYYRQRVGPLEVRIGRVPLEQGIYNEKRFVGTLVPFFRAPVSIYPEGIESTDGATVSYETPSFAGWSAQGTVSGGTSHYQDVVQTPTGTATPQLLFNPDVTGQLWILPPIQGLRVGLNRRVLHLKQNGILYRNRLWTGSVDGTFDRFFVRSEYSRYDVQFAPVKLTLGYAQGGVELVKGLAAMYQYDYQRWGYQTRPAEKSHDRAGGVRYAISPNVHLKLEHHLATGYRFDRYLSSATTGPGRTYYTIASLSLSF